MSECIIHSLLKHANITRVFDCFWCKDSIYVPPLRALHT